MRFLNAIGNVKYLLVNYYTGSSNTTMPKLNSIATAQCYGRVISNFKHICKSA